MRSPFDDVKIPDNVGSFMLACEKVKILKEEIAKKEEELRTAKNELVLAEKEVDKEFNKIEQK
jgi:hypothetical protein